MNTNISNLLRKESYELSNTDIKKIVGNVPIIKYPDLANYKTINDALGKKNAFVLFFETINNQTGHWQLVFKQGNVINFWDSYGLAPSGAKKYIQKQTLNRLKEFKPLLPNLLNQAVKNGMTVTYNKNDYQSWQGDVSTCGRFVSTRLLNRNLSEQEFYNYLQNYMRQNDLNTFDEAVTEITSDIIGK